MICNLPAYPGRRLKFDITPRLTPNGAFNRTPRTSVHSGVRR